MTERDTFVRQICAAPDDNDVRMIFADWLEEHGEAEYGEFIRTQIALANFGDMSTNSIADIGQLAEYDRLRHRELHELWNCGMPGTWVDTIRPPFKCIQCIDRETIAQTISRGIDPVLVYRRGFVEEVRTELLKFVGGECPSCRGYGRHADHSEAECTACGGVTGTGKCGTGETEGIAKELFLRQPVTKVIAQDRSALNRGDSAPGWVLDSGNDDTDGRDDTVPGFVFGLLENGAYRDDSDEDGEFRWFEYDDVEGAGKALSDALVRIGRDRAGL